MEERIVCPHCNLNDKIEKVSAIVSSQSHQISSYPYQVGAPTHQVSELAQSLMPPKKPEQKGLTKPDFYYRILILGFIGICPILLALSGDQTGSNLLLGLGALAFTVFYYLSSQDKLKKGEIEHKEAVNKWNDASVKWEHLFYCYRDDIVFNPIDNKTASPKDITQLYD
jgi:hypothetical protein